MQRLIVAVVIGLGVVVGLPVEAQAQATAKPQFIWNQQEREAVDAVKAWVNAWSTKDPQRVAELMADNLVFRADVSEQLQYGRDGFERIARGVMNGWCDMELEEVFVVGGDTDTVVLAKRIDYFSGNPPRGRGPGGLTGMAIPVAIMFRVKNGKITEWLDAPLIPVGPGAPPMPGARGRGGPPPGARPGGPGRGAAPPITPPTPCIGA
jgi:limonene-1,2-epoxide hydrolase